MELLLHPGNEVTVQAVAAILPQSILLSGEVGCGLLTIAREIADGNLTRLIQPLNTKNELDLERGTISAEIIRELYSHTRGKYHDRRVVIIDNADRMSRSAQSAFLKLLEEPPAATHFILTSHQTQQLLPTIRSRVQTSHFRPISEQMSAMFIKQNGISEDKKTVQLLFLASGRPAELFRLMKDEAYFKSQAAAIADARQFLLASSYDRLIIASRYFKNRSEALRLVEYSMRLLRRNLSSSPRTRLVRQLDQLTVVHANLEANASIRLQLTQFVL